MPKSITCGKYSFITMERPGGGIEERHTLTHGEGGGVQNASILKMTLGGY
jgi:hypothetical protein